ncbi:sensor histidine kinase [Spirosoma oryzicola]|uniref:sensor histidine kinase n=1 Tax=Spirosoma oryzicola TaxID=2898794 RepID=UPI001E31199B|nr:histidine kinase [Spirosoma oryzicola]UHG89623.1 histidine kinase [Spirosoma oryzicola]
MTGLNDKWFRLVGIPVMALLANWIFYDEINRQHNQLFWIDWIFSLLEVSLLWTISRYGILRSRRRYPDLSQTRPRILFQIVWFVITTGLVRLLTTFLYDTSLFWGYHYTPIRYVYNVAVGLFGIIPIAAIYEGMYLYRQWTVTYYEAQELKKINLQTQLESLKEQVKPHFLFNSLNTLQGLVMEDAKEQAVAFIINLSQVYRYLLQSNEQVLIPLSKELTFIQAYVELLKTRYEQGLVLELAIAADVLDYGLPPLTLQMLVENAVKHNRISTGSPLTIRIESDAAHNLLVVNNLQPKQTVVPSNQMGLANISAKYRLLNQSDPIIHRTEHIFQVSIPLLPNVQP